LKRLFAAVFAMLFALSCAACAAQAEEPAASATAVPFVPLDEYVYAEAVSSAINVKIYYPSHWENLPGRYTVCFQEPVEDGDVAARMAITCKQLSAKPSTDKIQRELASFLSVIIQQYDTYEVGNLSSDVTFMGKSGYWSIYKAVKGDREIRGYIAMVAVGSALYGFHFSCEEKDYADMSVVLERVRGSISSYK